MAKILLFAMIRRIRASRCIEYEPKHSIDSPRATRRTGREPLAGCRELAGYRETAKAMVEIRQKNGSKGSAPIPKSDTDSRLLPNKEGGYEANDTPMVTTESVGGLIVVSDVVSDVVSGLVEHHQLDTILDAVQNDFEVDAERVMADSADTTGENWTIAEAKNVELIGPLAETKCDANPTNPTACSRRGVGIMDHCFGTACRSCSAA